MRSWRNWQTHQLEGLALARAWWFESTRPHQLPSMAEIKTKKTAGDPQRYIHAITDEQVRADCRTIAKMMQRATKSKPKMWGSSIVGFGSCRYKYADGREME